MIQTPAIATETPGVTLYATLPSPPEELTYVEDYLLVRCRDGRTYKVTADAKVALHE